MSDRPARRVLAAIHNQPWAITEGWLQTILEIAARENPSIEAVEAMLGRPLDNTHEVTTRNGIATIPVEGLICRYASSFGAISGGTSIEVLAQDFTQAMNDPAVRGIILAVDSPGGEVTGTSELAQMIYEARGRKPIIAFAGGEDCSAAYWITSAADEVVVDDTAVVGSIGVVCAVPDPSADRSKQIQFVSSQTPNKRPDPNTESGKATIQSLVDDMASVFVQTVARNRAVDESVVMADFGAGGVFVGQKAVDAGLADRVGTYESVLAELSARSSLVPPIQRAAGRHTAQSPMTRQRSTPMKLKDFLLGRAEAEGVEIDPEDLDQAFNADAASSGDVSTLQAAMASRDAEIGRLKAAHERYEAQMAAAVERQRQVEATAYVSDLITAHRLTPAAAESLTPLLISAAASDAAHGTDTVAQVKAFAATLPDLSVFTTGQIAPDEAVALFATTKTTGLDGTEEPPTMARVAELLDMYPGGKALAAQMRQTSAGNGNR